MSDCINSEKPASGAAKNFPKERKSLPLLIRGRLGSDLIRPFGPPSPLRGRLCMVPCNHAPRGKYVLARRPVGPTCPLRSFPGALLPQGAARPSWVSSFLCLFWYTPFPGKCPVPTSGRSPALCPGTAAPTPPAAARRGRPGRPGADRSPPASGESGRAPCSGG